MLWTYCICLCAISLAPAGCLCIFHRLRVVSNGTMVLCRCCSRSVVWTSGTTKPRRCRPSSTGTTPSPWIVFAALVIVYIYRAGRPTGGSFISFVVLVMLMLTYVIDNKTMKQDHDRDTRFQHVKPSTNRKRKNHVRQPTNLRYIGWGYKRQDLKYVTYPKPAVYKRYI